MQFTTLKGNKIGVNLKPYEVKWKEKTRSKFQDRIKAFFFKYFKKLSWFEEVPLQGAGLTRLKWDFVCIFLDENGKEQLVFCECQGKQHDSINLKFHKSVDDLHSQAMRDELKVLFAAKNSKFPVIEIHPEDEPLTLEKFREYYPFLPVDKENQL